MNSTRYLSAQSAAKRLDVHPSTVYKMWRAGVLPSAGRVGRRLRFRVEDVDKCVVADGLSSEVLDSIVKEYVGQRTTQSI